MAPLETARQAQERAAEAVERADRALTVARRAVKVLIIGVLAAIVGVVMNWYAIKQINATRRESRQAFVRSDRRLCLAFNAITYRDRQTVRSSPKAVLASVALFARIYGLSVIDEKALERFVEGAKENSDKELARRAFVRCRKLPSVKSQ